MADGSGLASSWKSVIGFAGGGGSSVALKLATGCDPDVAMNHWMTAVRAHQRHFPLTEHHCTDIWETDPNSVLPGERIAFGWFSPDCTDFSKAKGKAPRAERIRGLGWSVIPWAVARRIEVIMLENVEEFAQWGPVYRCEDDVRAEGVPGSPGEPIKALRGTTFARWKSRLEALGYAVEWRILNAADYGAPTTRKRLYLVARCDGKPIVWPDRTHAPRKDAERLGLKPWRGACEIIDFSIDCPSILMTREEAKAYTKATGRRIQRPVVAATERRVVKGTDRYTLSAAEPFLVNVTQRTWGGDRAHGVRDPLPTLLSSKGGEYALVSPSLASVAHGAEARAWPVDEPARTQTGKHDKALVSASLVPRYGERPGQAPRALDVRGPLPTVVPDGNGASLAATHLVRQMGRSSAADAAEPAPTVMATGDGKTLLAAAHLVRQFGSAVGGRDAGEPLNTVMAQGERGGGKDQLVTAYMAQGNGGMPGREASDPVTTLTGRGTQQQLVAASLDSYYGSGSIGSDLAAPMRTSTHKARFSLIAAWLEQANTDMVGHELPAPVSTIVGKGCTQRLIEARLELDGGPVGRRARVLELFWSHFGVPTPEEWADPTGTLDARRKFGLVLIFGQTWMIVDIGLRMLTPGELAAAMGLPPEYDLSHDLAGAPISKTHQTQMIGNMVSPPPAAALIAANCPHLIKPNHNSMGVAA